MELITNGGFSTGSFAGWTVTSSQQNPYQANFTFGQTNVQVVNSVGGNPAWFLSTGGGATPGISGFTAFNGFDGSGGNFILSQAVTIAETVSAATLSFDFATTSSYSQQARTFNVFLANGQGATVATFFNFVQPFSDSTWGPATHVTLNVGAALNALAAGTYTLTFRETIPQNFTGPAAFGIDNISLNATFITNTAPVAVADSAAATEDGGAVTIAVLANDTDSDAGDTRSLVSVNGSGATGTVSVNANGTVNYDPGANYQSLGVGQTATDSFSYTMKDTAGLTSTATVTVTIAGANDGPAAIADTASATEDGGAVTIAVLDNDTDVDAGDSKTLVSVDATGTIGAASANADGTVTYNPGSSFQSLGAGQTATDSFSYTMQDAAGAISTATATVTITGVNDGPLAVADSGSVAEDQSITLDVLANDTDVDAGDTKTIVSVGATDLGSSVSIVDGKIVYSANADSLDPLVSGQSATDHFSYTMVDSAGETSVATVEVTIGGVADGADIRGGNKSQTLNGTALDEAIFGGNADDVMSGNDGADKLYGDNAKDALNGGAGRDALFGENGADVLNGGAGNDTLSGGNGPDLFVFGAGFGHDVITDFDSTDVVQFAAGMFANFAALSSAAQQIGSDVVISYTPGDSITLQGVALNTLNGGDFLFA